MIFLKKIIQNVRLLISKYLKIDLKISKENIYKNKETPSSDSILFKPSKRSSTYRCS